MGLILVVIAALVVVVIALVAVGRTVFQLEGLDAPVVLRVEDATEWIADRLPEETTARLSYEDVELVIECHLAWFADRGLATPHGEELAASAADRSDDLVAPVDEAHDFVVAALLAEAVPIESVDAVQVVSLHTEYLQLIGAFGDSTGTA